MNGKLYNSDNWIAVPMINKAGKAQGFAGGEGCRKVLCPVLDPVEGKYGLFGTEIGGVYRSVDGGKSWQIATLGFDSAGATGCAFDPANPSRCMVVGANSAAQPVNGLFLSTDYGDSWRSVLRAHTCNCGSLRQQIAYDPSSFDKELGYCTVVYWSREDDELCRNAQNDPALYRSLDGGENWQRLPDSAFFGGCELAVHPQKGWLYATKKDGFYRSVDKGESFEKTLSAQVLSLATVPSKPENVYLSTTEGIYISEDGGDSFYMLRGNNYPTFCPTRLAVSSADPNRMILQNDSSDNPANRFGHTTWYTHDGGKNWHQSTRHTEAANVAWCAENSALSRFSWHPTDKNRLICNWGYICSSDNGGKDFWYSSTGFSGVNTSGYVRFNLNDPDLTSMTSCNFNGAASDDGGATWDYINWSGNDWGGTAYSSYRLNDWAIFAAVRDIKHRHNRIFTSIDGGKTVIDSGIIVKGTTIAMGAVGKDNVGFMGEWRTEDYGRTWHEMTDCNGVFCADITTCRLFGIDDRNRVVSSDDDGLTWHTVADEPFGANDLAYCAYNERLYAVKSESLYYLDKENRRFIKAEQFDNGLVKNVAVDSGDPRMVYVSCKSDIYYSNKNVWRSEDGGESFVCLTRFIGDGRDDCLDGARRPCALAVNGKTGELFVFSVSKGVWKMPPTPNRKNSLISK